MANASHVELRGVRKHFGPVLANDGVSLAVRKGSIHAIVGENGAGKSTAMKILYGQYSPDVGEILVGGVARHWRSPADAIDAGLGMVHQHFMLAETHSALDNILLGTHRFAFSRPGRAAGRERLEKLMTEYGLAVDLDRPVGELPVGLQQRVEILKLLFRDSEVLILDEPTAVLAPGEIEALFRILRTLAAAGKTILVITHKLKEVMALAERVTIFRAGRVVGEREIAATTASALASVMIGREFTATAPDERPLPEGPFRLEVKSVAGREKNSPLRALSFGVREGEILGIAGVEGNGQSELLHLLMNPQRHLGAGAVTLDGNDLSRASARRVREAGVALFPEDRLREGLLLGWNLADNFLLGRQRSAHFREGRFFLSRSRLAEAARAAFREFDLRPAELEARAGSLSGGNQQKLVVARELWQQPRLLVAAQPTRGVDIGAIETIHARLRAVRDAGASVLLVSSELEEVLKLSDRVLVFYRGQIAGEFRRGAFDESAIGCLMAGVSREGAS